MQPVFICSERSLRAKTGTPGREDIIYSATIGRSWSVQNGEREIHHEASYPKLVMLLSEQLYLTEILLHYTINLF